MAEKNLLKQVILTAHLLIQQYTDMSSHVCIHLECIYTYMYILQTCKTAGVFI